MKQLASAKALGAVNKVLKGGLNSKLAQYGDDFGKMGQYVENPDIKISNGEIILQGTGDFKGKTLKTGLSIDDF